MMRNAVRAAFAEPHGFTSYTELHTESHSTQFLLGGISS